MYRLLVLLLALISALTETPYHSRAEQKRHVAPQRVRFDPKLHKWQRLVRQSRARFKVLAAGRRFGKTRLCVAITIARAISGGAVWWVAPTVDLTLRGWRPTLKICQRLPGVAINLTLKRIEFPGGGFIEFKTAGTDVSLRGEGLDLIIVEEAAHLDEARYTDELRPSLVDGGGDAIFISSPNGFNWFFELFERGQSPAYELWASWQFTSYANPFIDPSEVDLAADDMSDEKFAQEHLAQFLEGGGAPVFKRVWFAQRATRFDDRGPLGGPTGRNSRLAIGRFAGLDVANTRKEKSAFTALVIGEIRGDYSGAVRRVYRERLEYPQMRDWLIECLLPWVRDGKFRELYVENAANGIALAQDVDYAGPHWLRSVLVPVPVSNLKGGQQNDWRDAAPWVRRGMLALPEPDQENAEWLPAFEEELFNVPNHEYWDQATAFSHLVNNVQRREEAPLSTGWHTREMRRMRTEGLVGVGVEHSEATRGAQSEAEDSAAASWNWGWDR